MERGISPFLPAPASCAPDPDARIDLEELPPHNEHGAQDRPAEKDKGRQGQVAHRGESGGLMHLFSFNRKKPSPRRPGEVRRLWLDMGDLGVFVRPAGAHDRWQDHGLGILRTVLKAKGIETDLYSTRSLHKWSDLHKRVEGYDQLIMNVRSYTYP